MARSSSPRVVGMVIVLCAGLLTDTPAAEDLSRRYLRPGRWGSWQVLIDSHHEQRPGRQRILCPSLSMVLDSSGCAALGRTEAPSHLMQPFGYTSLYLAPGWLESDSVHLRHFSE
jgi:hypothetical protein